MFKTSKINSDTDLKSLVESVKDNLENNRVLFSYPEVLTNANGLKKWASTYKEIDVLNNASLLDVKDKAGVYALYVGEADEDPILKYIGQTNADGAKQRIRKHLVWRNKITKSGKYAGSKLDEIIKCVISGQHIYLSFCEISPPSLRHYVEENLFPCVVDGWNKQT